MNGKITFNEDATLHQIATLFRAFGGDLHCEFSALSRELTVDNSDLGMTPEEVKSVLDSVSDGIQSGEMTLDDELPAASLLFDGDRWVIDNPSSSLESAVSEPGLEPDMIAIYDDVRSWTTRYVAQEAEEW